MGSNHQHAPSGFNNEKALWLAFTLTFGFLIAEVVAGVLTRSLALISDAAHMFTDAAALAIALAAIRVARRPTDLKRSFGYHRFEILAAAFNALLLFGVAIYILVEAWQRFQRPAAIESTGMLVVASLGLIVNLISMRLLASGKDASLNIKGAYLEVWSDLLGSIGVIVAAVVIRYTGWSWVDSLVAVAIGLWVLPRTWVLLKESLNILLEGVPEGIDPQAVSQAMLDVPGVTGIHDLHIWALTSGKASMSAHVVHRDTVVPQELITILRTLLHDRFTLQHVTLQCEVTPCPDALDNPHWTEPRTALAARAEAASGNPPARQG
ncbi:cation diffusion facilitator family transporter [Aquabacterium sp. J223]|jgi:cobalt-zinc-cadmium efflux system protein|uniref:cation diffusion facilitator family transporter n=1 Tax=Aquabacterium sp. J223 TaxID=2898431 RepID=UPI0021AD9E33|nr:cation diffusion facilitator family transporter [Aquabacterium sp. J223]UUX96652.1 cation diffusion facilitator family transporter [Aquabacterium sp. J223]